MDEKKEVVQKIISSERREILAQLEDWLKTPMNKF